MNKLHKTLHTLLFISCLGGLSACDFPLNFSGLNDFITDGYNSSENSTSSSSSSATSYTPPPVVEKAVDLRKGQEASELEIFFFQLEHKKSLTQVGDSFLIKYGDIEILIDAGEQAVGTNVVMPQIRKYVDDGILELCINTHTDSDHMGGFLGTKDGSNYTGVFTTTNKIAYMIDSGYQASTQLYSNYLSELNKIKELGTLYYSYEQTMIDAEAPNKFILGDDTYLQILDSKMYENNFAGSSAPNDYSVPVLLSHGQKKCLFMGDAEKKAEQAVLTYNSLPEIDVYKANHHGSNTSNSKDLLDVIDPKYVIVDATANNQHNIPTKEILDRIYTYTKEIYTPFLNGGIHIYLTKDSIRFNCDGLKQYANNLNGAIKEGTEGAPTRIHDSDWYKNLAS